MDSVAWPLPLGGDDAAVFEAALDLIGDDDLFGSDCDRHCSVEGSSSSSIATAQSTTLSQTQGPHDAAAWDATLSFGEECDVGPGDDVERSDSDHSSQATTAPPSSDSPTTNPNTTTTRRARIRPKEELSRLRKEESELSSKLRKLRLEVLASSRDSESRKAPGNKLARRQHTLLFWERAASRQQQHRQQAEQENRRLTSLLQTQQRLARQLQQALNRLQTASRNGNEVDGGLITPVAKVAPGDNDAVFAVLFDGIEEIYADLNAHTSHSSSEQSPVPFGRSLDTKLLFLEHDETTAVPFELSVVQQALWKSIGSQLKRTSSSLHRTFVNYAGNVFQTSISRFLSNDGNPLYLQSQSVVRQFLEADRVVVVSKSRIEPKGAERGVSLGAVYTETNVRVLTPSSDDGKQLTAVRVHATLRRVVADGPFASYWGHEDDIRSSKAVWKHALASRNELLEEVLAGVTC